MCSCLSGRLFYTWQAQSRPLQLTTRSRLRMSREEGRRKLREPGRINCRHLQACAAMCGSQRTCAGCNAPDNQLETVSAGTLHETRQKLAVQDSGGAGHSAWYNAKVVCKCDMEWCRVIRTPRQPNVACQSAERRKLRRGRQAARPRLARIVARGAQQLIKHDARRPLAAQHRRRVQRNGLARRQYLVRACAAQPG